jgi:hypothetical protein
MEWISVKDKLPLAKEDVLFVATFGTQLALCFGYKDIEDPENGLWYDKTTCDYDGDPIAVYGVTHWMPLPELPK